jgi:hypothetical protein
MKQFEVIDLILEEIKVENASIESIQSDFNANESDSKISKVRFGLGFSKAFNIELQKVKIQVFLDIVILDENGLELGVNGKFAISFLFHVENLKDYIESHKDGRFIMETNLNGSMLSTAYSTSRGIIYTRCLGTTLKDIVLPIKSLVDLKEISNLKDNDVL